MCPQASVQESLRGSKAEVVALRVQLSDSQEQCQRLGMHLSLSLSLSLSLFRFVCLPLSVCMCVYALYLSLSLARARACALSFGLSLFLYVCVCVVEHSMRDDCRCVCERATSLSRVCVRVHMRRASPVSDAHLHRDVQDTSLCVSVCL